MSTIQEGSRLIIDADNRAALVVIVTAVGLSWTLLTLIIRIVSKFHMSRSVGLEENLVVAASITAAVSSACVLVSVSHGLGQRNGGIDEQENRTGLKLLWISDIFYIVTVGIAKAAALPLLKHLTRIRRIIIASYALAILTVLWAILSTLMITARCHLDAPWDDVSTIVCTSLYGRWVAIETVSILIEILIFLIFVSIIHLLKMRAMVKLKVILAFASRLPVIAPIILRMVYLQRGLRVDNNTTFALTNVVIATQVILHYTTMAASFAYLKPFLRTFDSNLGATVNVDTIVSSGYVSKNPSEPEGNRSRNKDDDHGTVSYVLRPLSKIAPLTADQLEQHAHKSLHVNKNTKHLGQPNTDVGNALRKDSASVQHNDSPRALGKKYTSQESMMPIITKTQEWSIDTEARDLICRAR